MTAEIPSTNPTTNTTPPIQTRGIPAGKKGRGYSQSRPSPIRNASAQARGGGITTLAWSLASCMSVPPSEAAGLRLAAHPLSDRGHSRVGREHGSLLPRRDVAQVFAREVERAVGPAQGLVGGLAGLGCPVDPGAEVLRHLVPGDGDSACKIVGVARVQPATVLRRECQALRRRERAHPLGDVVAPDVGAEQHALPAVEPGGGIPDLGDVVLGPGYAAVDPVVLLPEAAVRLEGDLHHLGVVGRLDRGADFRREIRGNAGEHGKREGADAIVGGEGARGPAPAVAVDDAHALVLAADLADFGAITDPAAQA